ncbi:hypothetical protein BH09MYX1_BH09MYX1_06490 [soil metagenome]
MHYLRLGLTLGVVALGVVVASCREPTEIMLEITTDVSCTDVATASGVMVRVGTTDAIESTGTTSIVATDCIDGNLGTLAIVPSGSDDDQVAILVAVASRSDASVAPIKSVDCSASSPNCIVAKRVLSYIPHTELKLPIHLSLKCAGVDCGTDRTCVDGECRSTKPECTKTEGCNPTPPVVDAGPRLDQGVPEASLDVKIPDVISVSDGCVTCGNSACIDLSTSSAHCGHCGFACAGACINGACKLAPSTANSGACIATSGPVTIFTTAGTPAAAYWVPRGGGNATVIESLQLAGAVASGAGITYVGATSNQSLYSDETAATPPSSNGNGVMSYPSSAYLWPGRSSAGVRCLTSKDPNGSYVMCPEKFGKQVLPYAAGPIAVGQTGWATIIQSGANAAVVVGDFQPTVKATYPVPNARMIAVAPGTDQVFIAAGLQILTLKNAVLTTVWTSTAEIRGLHFDSAGTTLYFVESIGTTSTIRKIANDGSPVLQAPVVFTGNLDRIGEVACIDADDVAVYFLDGGAPFRVAK